MPLLAAAAAVALTGCAAQAETYDQKPPAPRAYTVQQLASAIGCDAKVTLKAKDYRQAECTHEGIKYWLFDFDQASGQREWLDYAEMYGGIYLTGDRWALSAKSKEYMVELSKKIGGTVEVRGADGSAPTPGPSGSTSPGHHYGPK